MPSSPSISLVLSHPRTPAVPRVLPGPCLPAFAYTCSSAYNAGVCDGPSPTGNLCPNTALVTSQVNKNFKDLPFSQLGFPLL